MITQHISNEFSDFNLIIPKQTTAEVNLKRKAQGIYPTVMKAKAWLDRSCGNVEIETNDLLYEEKLLLLPEIVNGIRKHLEQILKLMERNLVKK